MKRRRFLGSLAAVAAAPAVALIPAASVDAAPIVATFDSRVWYFSKSKLDALTSYEFAEWRAAMISAIARSMAVPYEQLALDFSERRAP